MNRRSSRIITIFLLLMVVLMLYPSGLHADAKPIVRMYIFTSPECSHCVVIKNDFLKNLAEKVGCTIDYKLFDIEDMENYQKLVDMEERYGDTDNEVPVIFIGKDLLAGEKETESRIEEFVAKYAKQGGVGWPEGKSDEVKASSPSPAVKLVPTNGGHPAVTMPTPEKLAQTEPQILPAAQKTPETLQEAGKAALPESSKVSEKPEAVQEAAAKPDMPEKKSLNHTYMALFYEYSCKECDRIFYLMKFLRNKHPNLVVKEFSLSDNRNKILNEAVSEKYGVPEKKRMTPATLFIGSDYLLLDDIKLKKIEMLLDKYEATGSACPWDIKIAETASAEKSIIERFKSLGPLTVAFAGLIDGINPCAFTTLIFFISYLMYLGKKGKEILYVGASFAAGVFIAYFLIGCGAFGFMKYISASHMVTRVINVIVASVAIVLGIVSFADFLKARKGMLNEISLQLPAFLKKRIHKTVRTSVGTSRHAAAALLAGLTISVLELACTGQVYLPTIIFVVSQAGLRKAGLAYLFLYNLMFIMPLVGIFLVAYRGTTSEKLVHSLKTHVAPVKLGTSLFFVTLGIFLLVS